jgi:hypothetical protein
MIQDGDLPFEYKAYAGGGSFLHHGFVGSFVMIERSGCENLL